MAYKEQVELLLDVLPYALDDERFVLKGGTAINLFVRDMPRLSVDIDLTYVPIESRKISFKNIHEILNEIKKKASQKLSCKVTNNYPLDGEKEAKLLIERNGAKIKLEPNYTLRGTLIEPVVLTLCGSAQGEFEREVDASCLDSVELYAGKICAALDRQHPRDWFDIHVLLENEGFSEELKDVFLVYLLSHNRPMLELLNPAKKCLKEPFESQLKGMERIDIDLEELEKTRDEFILKINKALTKNDKELLISFLEMKPKWDKAKFPNMKDLPGIRWKLKNIEKMDDEKRKNSIKVLKEFLEI